MGHIRVILNFMYLTEKTPKSSQGGTLAFSQLCAMYLVLKNLHRLEQRATEKK
jgi:hypothetical protein